MNEKKKGGYESKSSNGNKGNSILEPVLSKSLLNDSAIMKKALDDTIIKVKNKDKREREINKSNTAQKNFFTKTKKKLSDDIKSRLNYKENKFKKAEKTDFKNKDKTVKSVRQNPKGFDKLNKNKNNFIDGRNTNKEFSMLGLKNPIDTIKQHGSNFKTALKGQFGDGYKTSYTKGKGVESRSSMENTYFSQELNRILERYFSKREEDKKKLKIAGATALGLVGAGTAIAKRNDIADTVGSTFDPSYTTRKYFEKIATKIPMPKLEDYDDIEKYKKDMDEYSKIQNELKDELKSAFETSDLKGKENDIKLWGQDLKNINKHLENHNGEIDREHIDDLLKNSADRAEMMDHAPKTEDFKTEDFNINFSNSVNRIITKVKHLYRK